MSDAYNFYAGDPVPQRRNFLAPQSYRDFMPTGGTTEEGGVPRWAPMTPEQRAILHPGEQVSTVNALAANPPFMAQPVNMRTDYDLLRAKAAGMTPGPDGHMGSVAPATPGEVSGLGLSPSTEAYRVLKSANHPTYNLGVQGENAREFNVVPGLDGRNYSIPRTSQDVASDSLRRPVEALVPQQPSQDTLTAADRAAGRFGPTGTQFGAFGEAPTAKAVPTAKAAPSAAYTPTGNPVNDAIGQAAAKYGLNPAILRSYANIESGLDPKVSAGSYHGLFQLSRGEFARHGGGDIFSPGDNASAAARKMVADSSAFQSRTGKQPDAADLYMIHQQGFGGYSAHLRSPERPAWQNMASTAEGRAKGKRWAKAAIWGNLPPSAKERFGSVDNVTSQQFTDWWRARVQRQLARVSASNG